MASSGGNIIPLGAELNNESSEARITRSSQRRAKEGGANSKITERPAKEKSASSKITSKGAKEGGPSSKTTPRCYKKRGASSKITSKGAKKGGSSSKITSKGAKEGGANSKNTQRHAKPERASSKITLKGAKVRGVNSKISSKGAKEGGASSKTNTKSRKGKRKNQNNISTSDTDTHTGEAHSNIRGPDRRKRQRKAASTHPGPKLNYNQQHDVYGSSSSNSSSSNHSSRKASTTTIIIGGVNNQHIPCRPCWELTEKKELNIFCAIPDGHRAWYGVCKTPGGFTVTGGNNIEGTQCAMFVMLTKSWMPLTSLPHSRYAHGSAFLRNRIFLFGGFITIDGHRTQSSSVISLNPDGGDTEGWQGEADLPFTVGYPEIASIEEANGSVRTFLFDGYTNSLLSLDTENNTWIRKASMPGKKSFGMGAGMTVVHRTLLVAGGMDRCFARYNTDTDTWVTGPPPSLKHYFGALVSCGESVYLMGGSKEDRVEEYDLASDDSSWSMCDWRLPAQMYGVQALSLDS